MRRRRPDNRWGASAAPGQAGESPDGAAVERETPSPWFAAGEALRVWREISRVVCTVPGEAALLQAVCDALVTLDGCARARVGLLDPSDPCVVRFAASAGRSSGAPHEEAFRVDGEGASDALPLVRALETGEPAVCSVAVNTFFRLWFSSSDGRGFCGAFPLRHGRDRFGVLALFSPDPVFFSEGGVRFLGELADTTAHAIGALRQRQSCGESARALRTAETLLQAALCGSPMLLTVRDTEGHLTRVLTGGQALPPGFSRQSTLDLCPAAGGERPPGGLDARDLRLLAGGGQNQEERIVTAPDGAGRSLWVNRGPLFDPEGQPLGLYEVIHDISDLRRVQKQARLYAARYHNLFQAVSDACVIFTADGSIATCNPAAERLFGAAAETLRAAAPERWLLPQTASGEDAAAAHRQLIARALAEGSVICSMRCRRVDGPAFDAEVRAVRFDDPGRRRVLASIRDVSREKEDAARLLQVTRARTVLSNVGQAMVRADSEEAMIAGACRALAGAGGYAQSWGIRLDVESGCRLRVVAYGRPLSEAEERQLQEEGADGVFPERHALARAIQSGLPEVCRCHESRDTMLCLHLGGVPAGVRACAAVPIWDGATLYGALAVCATVDDAFTEEEFEFLKELSRNLSFGITALRARLARLAAEQKRHETAELLRNAIEGSSDFIYIVDFWGRYLQFLNRGGLIRYGIDPDRVVGRTATQVWGVEIGRHAMERHQQILARGTVVQEEETVLAADGGARQLWVTNGPLRGEDGRLQGVFGILRDVTDFRRAERVLRANSERLEVLQELVGRRFDSEDDLIRAGLAEIMRITGSTVGSFNTVADGHMRVTMQIRQGGETLKAPFLSEGAIMPLAGTPWAACVETRKPLVTNAAAVSLGDGALRFTLNRQICVPVVVNDRVEVLAGVANKASDYEEIDVQQVRLFMENLWQLVLRLRADEHSRALRDRLEQSQKLELVGHLTGGIAHDFNNLLQVINGYAEFMLNRMEPDDLFRGEVNEIFDAGRRAAHMTGRLLAFSRRQVARQEPVCLNRIIREMEKMLRRLIGETIELRAELDPALPDCLADNNQIEQVLLNLCVNARDAMAKGGAVTIRTQTETLDAVQAAALKMNPGPVVALSVADTGTGMSPTVKEHLFEPFFTTKERGKGTGLGLATVYGIVTQHNGHIGYVSETGVGTTCTILLPALRGSGTPDAAEDVDEQAGLNGAGEWLLVGEDEEPVRKMLSRTLTTHGYRVLEAADGADVLRLYEQNRARVAMIICDVCMPGKGGLEMEEELRANFPDAPPVLFVTGYADLVENLRADGKTIELLLKPVSAEHLLRRIQEMIGGAGRRAVSAL